MADKINIIYFQKRIHSNLLIHCSRNINLNMRQTQVRQEFAFPLMKVGAIVFCLQQAGIIITEDGILNPEKNVDLRSTFEQLARLCTGITEEEMSQPAFSGLSALSFPELHDDSVRNLNSFRACSKMMELCGVQDFTIKDFILPTSKRVRRQLSAIINFAKFRGEKHNLLMDLTGTRQSLMTSLKSVQIENETLNDRLLLLKEQTSEEAKLISEIENDCIDMENDISNLNQNQAIIREETTELKSKNNSLKDEISMISLQLEEMLALRKKMAGQIVNSPERFRNQILDVGKSLQAEQNDAKNAERKVRELSLWLNSAEESQIQINHALEVIHELKSESEKQKLLQMELDNQKQLNQSVKTKVTDLEQEVFQFNRQVTRTDDKLQHLRKQASVRVSENQLSVDELHKQLINAENNRAQVRIVYVSIN